jgi:hypothetical protein
MSTCDRTSLRSCVKLVFDMRAVADNDDLVACSDRVVFESAAADAAQ